MPVEFRADKGELVWVRNPFTGAVTYFTHVHKKRSGFVREAQEALLRPAEEDPAVFEAQLRHELEAARGRCPFCPGNEHLSPEEVLRIRRRDVFGERAGEAWVIRAVCNLIPRIPECCTGGRNESYVVVEDSRHFADDARGHSDLIYSALLPPAQFQAVLRADVEVARRAYANPAVRQVLIRKNQGHESGASQPHLHSQVIGSDQPFAVVARECEVTRTQRRIWEDVIAFSRERGFLIDERDGCFAYFCPFGVFPRSYEIVCLDAWTRLIDVPQRLWQTFGAMLRNILDTLGPMPLDYEIHDGPGVPLHAHVNARQFPYSNIGGTLNLPALVGAGTAAKA